MHALAANPAVRTAAVDADVVLMDVCNGLYLGRAVDFESSLAHALMHTGQLQAIALPWTTYVRVDDPYERVMSELRSGRCIGEAVSRFNSAIVSSNPGLRLAILGEPRAMLSTPRLVAAPAPAPTPEGDPNGSSISTTPHSAPMHAQPSVEELLRLGGVYFHSWSRDCLGLESVIRVSCAYCGAPALQYLAALGAGSSRTLEICPCCGVVADSPSNPAMNIQLEGGTFRIITTGDTAGELGIRLACKDHRFSRAWLLDDGSAIGRSFRLGGAAPPGPLRLQAIWRHDGQLWLASRPIPPQDSGELLFGAGAHAGEILLD